MVWKCVSLCGILFLPVPLLSEQTTIADILKKEAWKGGESVQVTGILRYRSENHNLYDVNLTDLDEALFDSTNCVGIESLGEDAVDLTDFDDQTVTITGHILVVDNPPGTIQVIYHHCTKDIIINVDDVEVVDNADNKPH